MPVRRRSNVRDCKHFTDASFEDCKQIPISSLKQHGTELSGTAAVEGGRQSVNRRCVQLTPKPATHDPVRGAAKMYGSRTDEMSAPGFRNWRENRPLEASRLRALGHQER